MRHLIAVDDDLQNMRQYLEDNGYETTGLDAFEDACVFVVSGMDSNLFGDEAISTKAHVIEARGLTAAEILDEVERAIRTEE